MNTRIEDIEKAWPAAFHYWTLLHELFFLRDPQVEVIYGWSISYESVMNPLSIHVNFQSMQKKWWKSEESKWNHAVSDVTSWGRISICVKSNTKPTIIRFTPPPQTRFRLSLTCLDSINGTWLKFRQIQLSANNLGQLPMTNYMW